MTSSARPAYIRFSGVSILNCPDYMLLFTATRYRLLRFCSEKVLSLFLNILLYIHACICMPLWWDCSLFLVWRHWLHTSPSNVLSEYFISTVLENYQTSQSNSSILVKVPDFQTFLRLWKHFSDTEKFQAFLCAFLLLKYKLDTSVALWYS